MRIDQTVHVPADPDRVWAFLDDIPAVAGCMPGATLTRTVDGVTHEGQVKVAIGPLTMNYAGVVTIVDRDETARTVRLRAFGRDRRGSGTAQADLTVAVTPGEDGTRLRVVSDLRLTGRVAALGRGVNDVAGRLFAEFADRLTAELGAPRPAAATPVAAGDGHRSGSQIKVGALLWSITRERLGAFLVRLGERVRPAAGPVRSAPRRAGEPS